MPRPLRVATRGSELARWQAHRVATLLGADTELVVVSTTGDQQTEVPIHAVGGTGIFVKEVQQALLDGRADVAVHSAKDLPASDTPDGLVLAATPERADPRDALVGSTLDALPAGARVATGSVRRRAQLVRLGLDDQAAELLEPSVLLPQVGQGALAVECRTDDDDTLARVVAIDDHRVHAAVDAERAYLAELGGGCDLPCGALAHVDDDEIAIEALLAATDGHVVLRATARAADPMVAGRAVAAELMDRGGRSLLESSSR
jgi:hydroxymethylbilane synthase